MNASCNSDDGFSTLQAALSDTSPRAKPPLFLPFNEIFALPSSEIFGRGIALLICYKDGCGVHTKRWITLRKGTDVDLNGNCYISAFCWKRRQARNFLLDRILDIADSNGEIMEPELFFLGLL